MTIEDFTTEWFCYVDDKLSQHGKNRKHGQTLGISIALGSLSRSLFIRLIVVRTLPMYFSNRP